MSGYSRLRLGVVATTCSLSREGTINVAVMSGGSQNRHTAFHSDAYAIVSYSYPAAISTRSAHSANPGYASQAGSSFLFCNFLIHPVEE